MNTGSHFEVKDAVAAGDKQLPAPRQARSKATANLFVATALELLQHKTYAELSVAELAEAAGRSVGVFYQRFGSKDDFLAVLLSSFFDQSVDWRSNNSATGSARNIYLSFLKGGYEDISSNRNLWHAALERSASDPEFWKGFGALRDKINGITREALEKAQGRPFTEDERHRLALAGQVFNSVINNQIINAPGPLELGDERFFPELSEIVLNIAPFGEEA